MESVILSGPTQCKIKRKYPLPSRFEGDFTNVDYNTVKMQPTSTMTEGPEEENDPYYVWRRNAPFLYDSLMVSNLDWPSLVVEFMDDSATYRVKNNVVTHRLLLGTHTSGAETEYAMVAELRAGVSSMNENLTTCENYNGFLAAKRYKSSNSSFRNTVPSLDIKAKMVHPGEINRISHVPGSNFKFVTQSNNGTILFFDYSKHPSNPRDLTLSMPQILLTDGHNKEGYGLSWNKKNLLVSCATDGTVCSWDLNKSSSTHTQSLHGISDNVPIVTPLNKFTVVDDNTVPLNDVKFMPKEENTICVAGDDGSARIYDLRTNESPSLYKSKSELNCISFNSFDNRMFITGDSGGLIMLCDVRNLKKPLKVLKHHRDPISQIEFCSGSAGMFASAAHNTVCIWDFGCLDDELRFVHSGHRDVVSDLSWSKCNQYSIIYGGFSLASVASDNSLHCYTPNYLVL